MLRFLILTNQISPENRNNFAIYYAKKIKQYEIVEFLLDDYRVSDLVKPFSEFKNVWKKLINERLEMSKRKQIILKITNQDVMKTIFDFF